MTPRTIALAAGGFVKIDNTPQHIELAAFSGLGPASTPTTLTRDEAEAVHKAIGQALARLRGDEARPTTAVPIEAVAPRKRKGVV